MNSTQRIKAMLAGKRPDQLCTSAWWHMPMVDKNPRDLAKATIDFVENNQFDFVKMMYNTSFFCQDFGMEVEYSRNPFDWMPRIRKPAAVHVRDFCDIPMPNPSKGNLGRQLEATKIVSDHFAGTVPVIGTLFTPLSLYKDMVTFCSGDSAYAAMRHDPRALHRALEMITETSIRFLEELKKVGADGVFIASHFCGPDMPEEYYREFIRPYDLQVMEKASELMWFNIHHIHGSTQLMMDRFLDYPCQAISWEDCFAGPDSGFTMADIRKKTDKILIGGIEMWSDYYSETNDRDAVKATLLRRGEEAVKQAGFGSLILAPGCAAPLDVPPYRFSLQHEVAVELTERFR